MNTVSRPCPHGRSRPVDVFLLLRVAAALAVGLGLCVISHGASAQVEQWSGVSINLSQGIRDDDFTIKPQSVQYLGRKQRAVYDRRVDKTITINAFVFKVNWPNGGASEGIINPEFGSRANARQALDRFLPVVGKLPFCLRKRIDEIKIHKGDEAFGGGDNGLLFYNGRSRIGSPEFEEIVVHEAGHDLGQQIQDSTKWRNAQKADRNQDSSGRRGFISTYARDNETREDVSESFLAWLLLRKRGERLTAEQRAYIESTIPNRLKYFDDWGCNTHPVGL